MAGLHRPIREGEYTATVYALLRDQKYDEVVRILNQERQNFPRSRAALSLLGYAYYHMQDFVAAEQVYGQLTAICPEVDEYKIYHAQALLKAGLYEEATQVCTTVEDHHHDGRLLVLQATIQYEQDEIQLAQSMIDTCAADDPDRIVLESCIMWKGKKYEEARLKFTDAMNQLGYQADLAYNIALCYYSMKQYGPA
eukprot:CAMPEP_0204374272 /NCGR_PEP_ID=MMETSP0469-20131031/48551_1 /ASSEMBLY_ACC=CAM_ASM_000384 /TAXON_ID=2969 /ORGANISM="Oxyrrhis marina" /LENGTH=195 /DNA_ID=CAMNT_0051364837 /DNA_START=1 /DNA_END=585 /DNA_ORIENTATION=-